MITALIMILYLYGLYYLYAIDRTERFKNTVGVTEPMPSTLIVVFVLLTPNWISLGIFTAIFIYLIYVDLR